MREQINFSNFQVIFRNSIPMYTTYKFINVVPYVKYKHQDAIVFSIDNEPFILEVSVENVDFYSHKTIDGLQMKSSKEECVENSIRGNPIFLKHAGYLYKSKSGRYGRYNIETQIFEPFDDVNSETMIHKFYFDVSSL